MIRFPVCVNWFCKFFNFVNDYIFFFSISFVWITQVWKILRKPPLESNSTDRHANEVIIIIQIQILRARSYQTLFIRASSFSLETLMLLTCSFFFFFNTNSLKQIDIWEDKLRGWNHGYAYMLWWSLTTRGSLFTEWIYSQLLLLGVRM